ncbi:MULTISPECIES: beta-phosphoglucomutase [unclassified Spirosoma]|uniref:beta-phosphoglucomutase n=1 Tax=unclassified Spirosoma TaxID=2621999 RepID=UPI00095B53F1|nr:MULTISPECIES: beta-phosphoglucomutase [unclassified Spirosoma]MBN8826946.1 beta-phosphoglucomutase [Spirosoma sp.]OJW70674.1 MAG: beta-phosphoglucomutase [Spirosoma sp. 48-14]
MPIKAFLFDLDGVIVDTAIYHYQAWKRLANELGFDISEAFNESLKGVSRMESLDLILAHGGLTLPDEKKAELAAQKNTWYLELVSRMTPGDILPGVASFFAQVRKAGLKTALGSVSKNAGMILDRIGMTDAFDAVIDGNKISKGKPDPEVFTKGAAELGFDPAECVVFEDAVAGVEAGKRGGMFVVGLGSPEILTQADLVAPSLEVLTVEEVLTKAV